MAIYPSSLQRMENPLPNFPNLTYATSYISHTLLSIPSLIFVILANFDELNHQAIYHIQALN